MGTKILKSKEVSVSHPEVLKRLSVLGEKLTKNDFFVKKKIRKQAEQIERQQLQIRNAILQSRNTWQQYQDNIEFVVEEDLINYFAYLIKAEESKIKYLNKQLS